jgi:hypothetical protein
MIRRGDLHGRPGSGHLASVEEVCQRPSPRRATMKVAPTEAKTLPRLHHEKAT